MAKMSKGAKIRLKGAKKKLKIDIGVIKKVAKNQIKTKKKGFKKAH